MKDEVILWRHILNSMNRTQNPALTREAKVPSLPAPSALKRAILLSGAVLQILVRYSVATELYEAVGRDAQESKEMPTKDPNKTVLVKKEPILKAVDFEFTRRILVNNDHYELYVKLTKDGAQRLAEFSKVCAPCSIAAVIQGKVLVVTTLNEPITGGSFSLKLTSTEAEGIYKALEADISPVTPEK